MNNYKIIILLIVLFHGCSLPELEDIPLNGEYAIPLINSVITIENLLEQRENATVEMSQDGALTLKYEASLLSESISDLLPSIPSIGEVPILDTVSFFPLSSVENFIITKAIFSGDQMRFRFTHDRAESVNIHLMIPELTKEGSIFEFDYVLNAQEPLPYTEFTPSFDLAGYEFNSDDNQLTFKYDARNPANERIKLEFAAMSFNQLIFSYGEGNYERAIYPLEGDSLAISALNGWKSGQLEFEDPRISFNISHSYGFPVAVKINKIDVHTFDETTKPLTSDKVGEEILLDYPALNNVGQVVSTQISFSKENSNINTLFNEKVKYVDYDLQAIINPNSDLSITGFATDESFFVIDADLELPLTLRINELCLQDTIDLKKPLPDRISEAEFKVISENSYPLQMKVYFVFLDENMNVLERFLENDPLIIEPAQEKTRFINLEPEVINKIKSAKKIIVVPEFDTENVSEDFVRLSSQQSMELRVGLKFKL